MVHNYPCGEKEICTGCAACAAACPIGCIKMQPDQEGFFYPVTDTARCTDCGRCQAVCPVRAGNQLSALKAPGFPRVFASWHLDDGIRFSSSSGGVFTALAENVLARGGVVIGAAFDDRLVVRHLAIESSGDLQRLRGSKYVQSEIGDGLYANIKDMLRQGRPVLFSGTPCQVAALRALLSKAYDNLYCCDLVCHGVPSPKLLSRYTQNAGTRRKALVHVDFRDKTKGWKRFGMRQRFDDGHSRWFSMWADVYVAAFLRNYSLRPSCYVCPFTQVDRQGDLTLADFWGVGRKYPEYDKDDKGTSLVLVNTQKGADWLKACRSALFLGEADVREAMVNNPMLTRPSERPVQRNTFYADLENLPNKAFIQKYHIQPPSLIRRGLSKSKRLVLTLFAFLRKS